MSTIGQADKDREATLDLPYKETRRLLREREISPIDLVNATFDAIEKSKTVEGMFVSLDRELALERAVRLEDAPNREVNSSGPMWGIPLPIKDLEPARGFVTTYGAKASIRPQKESESVLDERLSLAGAIIFGKSNTPAFGHKDTTDNLLLGPARNPHDITKTAGGSSGGAAAAVAAGLCGVAHATDGAGSARIPAAFCGVVGYKPSYGLIPKPSGRDLWGAFSHHGFVGKSVDYVEAAVRAVAGPDQRDPLSYESDALFRHPMGIETPIRACYDENLGRIQPTTEVTRLCRAVMDELKTKVISVASVSAGLSDPAEWFGHLWRPQLARQLDSALRLSPSDIDNSLMQVVSLGRESTVDDILNAANRRSKLYHQAVEVMLNYDVIISPAMPSGAWPVTGAPNPEIGIAAKRPPGGRWGHMIYGNVLGWPCITVPIGKTKGGLPVGIHVMSAWRRDDICLYVARMIEKVAAI